METSEIKARIASLLDIPLSKVVLIQRNDVTANFSFRDGNFVIEYKDNKTLAHEFLHGCFSPRMSVDSKALNALEDYRMTVKAEQYDKPLAQCNNESYEPEEITKIMRTAKDDEDGNKFKALAIASIPMQNTQDIGKLIDKHVNLATKDQIKDVILNARESLKIDPSLTNLSIWATRLNDLTYLRDKQKERGQANPDDKDLQRKDEEEQAEQRAGFGPSDEFKRKVASKGEIQRLSKQEETVLIKALNNIIRNKSIGRKQNTIKGKLKTKRLGHFPSNYLFEKKDKPKPETSLYILADISGSMDSGNKLKTVLKFLNSVRLNKVKNLKINIRCFNTYLFKDDEIPYYEGDLLNELMLKKMPESTYGGTYCGFNDDAHWLNETILEIQADPTPNKALLILSDGEPAPSRNYEMVNLSKIASTVLPKTGIPYMSVGIESNSVENYYAKSRVAYNPQELVELLLRHSAELVK